MGESAQRGWRQLLLRLRLPPESLPRQKPWGRRWGRLSREAAAGGPGVWGPSQWGGMHWHLSCFL